MSIVSGLTCGAHNDLVVYLGTKMGRDLDLWLGSMPSFPAKDWV
jgi:hypothetical protein